MDVVVMIRHRLSYYLLSIENDRSCIIDYEGGKWIIKNIWHGCKKNNL